MFQAMCHTLFTAAAAPFAKSSATGSEASQLASVGLGFSTDCSCWDIAMQFLSVYKYYKLLSEILLLSILAKG
jgi:hypothetical protein